jgi:hypothetical protein
MFNKKTINRNSTPNNGVVTEKNQKIQRYLKNKVVFGKRNFNSVIPKPHYEYECENYGRFLLKSKIKSALKSNTVPGPGLPHNLNSCNEALGYSSETPRGHPYIYGPPQDLCGCQGGGCPRCWKN